MNTNIATDSTNTLEPRVFRLVHEHLIPSGTTTLETSFDEIGADSLDMVELGMAFEEEFGIEVNDDEIQNVRTIGEALDLVNKKLSPTT